jgi:hypothetical protein
MPCSEPIQTIKQGGDTRVNLIHSFPSKQRTASPLSLGRRAEYRNDLTMHRHAGIAPAPSVLLLGATARMYAGKFKLCQGHPGA